MACARLSAMVLIVVLPYAAAAAEPSASNPSASNLGVAKPMPSAASALPTVSAFGRLPDGREAHLYTLEVPGGWKATITDFGAILTSLHVPGKDGKPVDIVLGFDSLDGYAAKHPYFGATCGRVANRIAAGRFELNGKAYTLATNN